MAGPLTLVSGFGVPICWADPARRYVRGWLRRGRTCRSAAAGALRRCGDRRVHHHAVVSGAVRPVPPCIAAGAPVMLSQ